MEVKGEIYRVSGPVVTAEGIAPRMYDVVLIGHEKLMGEVIGLLREPPGHRDQLGIERTRLGSVLLLVWSMWISRVAYSGGLAR